MDYYAESKLTDPPETNISDLPPESFWVARDDEQDWFDRNAVMQLQRKTSLKLGFNRNFTSFSHRSDIPKPLRPSVFGLPNTHKSTVLDGNPTEKKPVGVFLFRSRSEPGGKSIIHVPEPVSPRVSCTGRVGFKSADGGKTRFTRLFSSFFRTRSKTNRSRERGC